MFLTTQTMTSLLRSFTVLLSILTLSFIELFAGEGSVTAWRVGHDMLYPKIGPSSTFRYADVQPSLRVFNASPAMNRISFFFHLQIAQSSAR